MGVSDCHVLIHQGISSEEARRAIFVAEAFLIIWSSAVVVGLAIVRHEWSAALGI